MVSGTQDNPSTPSYPGRDTKNSRKKKFKKNPNVHELFQGTRQLGWMSCLTSAGAVTWQVGQLFFIQTLWLT